MKRRKLEENANLEKWLAGRWNSAARALESAGGERRLGLRESGLGTSGGGCRLGRRLVLQGGERVDGRGDQGADRERGLRWESSPFR